MQKKAWANRHEAAEAGAAKRTISPATSKSLLRTFKESIKQKHQIIPFGTLWILMWLQGRKKGKAGADHLSGIWWHAEGN